MIYLSISLYLLLVVAILTLEKKRIAAIAGILYLSWWGLCLFLSSFNPIGLKSVSSFAYSLIILNILAFVIGFLYASRTDKSIHSCDGFLGVVCDFEKNIRRSKAVVCLLLALMLYLAFYYVRYQHALADVGPAQARNIRFFVGPVFRSTIAVLFFNYIIEALSNLLLVIVAYSLVIGRFFSLVSITAVIDLILFSLIGSGRGIIAEECVLIAFFALILRYLFPSGSKREKLNIHNRLVTIQKKNVLLYGGMAIVGSLALLAYITAKRLDVHGLSLKTLAVGGKEFALQSVIYTTGSFRALDYALHNANLYGFHIGRMTLAGIDELFGYYLRGMGIDYQVLNTSIGAITGAPIDIGAGIMFNALYTCIFPFYFDFGILGVIAFSLFFGLSVRFSISAFMRKPSFVSFLLMAFMFKTCLFSIQNWPFSAPSAVIFLASLLAVYIKKNMKKRRPDTTEKHVPLVEKTDLF